MAAPIILRTERLLLRPPLLEDAAQIAAQIGLRDVAWNLGRVPLPYSLEDAEAWLEQVPGHWADDTAYILAMTLPDDTLIGCISLRQMPMEVWELGYWLGKSWWGRGFTSEAAKAFLNWAETDKSISRFASGHFLDNPASGSILLKLGFDPVGEAEAFSLSRGIKSPALRYTKGTEPDLALRLVAH